MLCNFKAFLESACRTRTPVHIKQLSFILAYKHNIKFYLSNSYAMSECKVYLIFSYIIKYFIVVLLHLKHCDSIMKLTTIKPCVDNPNVISSN